MIVSTDLWHLSEFFHLNVIMQIGQVNGFVSECIRLWFHNVERLLNLACDNSKLKVTHKRAIT